FLPEKITAGESEDRLDAHIGAAGGLTREHHLAAQTIERLRASRRREHEDRQTDRREFHGRIISAPALFDRDAATIPSRRTASGRTAACAQARRRAASRA